MKSFRNNIAGRPQLTRGSAEIIREFWRNSKGYRWLFIPFVLGIIGDGLLQSGLVGYMKVMIDRLIADPTGFVRDGLLRYTLLGIGAGLLFFTLAYVSHFVTLVLKSRLAMRFRLALYSHMQRLSLSFYQKNQTGEISRRLTADIDNGTTHMVHFAAMCCWAGSLLACSLGSMLLISWKLTAIFVALNALCLGITRIFIPKIRLTSREVQDRSGEMNARVTEDVAAVSLIKAFAREDRFYDRFRAGQERLYTTQLKAGLINILYSDILQTLFIFIAPVVILGTGAWLVDRGLSVGSLVAFWGYWQIVRGPSQSLFNGLGTFYHAAASIDRVMDFFAQQPMPKDLPGARRVKFSQGKVEFRNLSFAYPGSDAGGKPVLDEVSFTVPPHSSLGIVGPSGAGKSTLIQLLLRFHDPDAGSLLIDGVPIREMTQASLRDQIGVVFQDSIMLSGSIRENLLVGRENASEAQMWKALEMAGAAEFVRNLEKGLDSELGERGVNLSGGQRQRLSIARVFLKNPPIVVFDEATSALDTVTEDLVQDSMRRLLAGRTSLTIAHRLSTVMACDRILLDQGRIVGLAPHAELLRTSQLYADLVRKQLAAAVMPKND